MHPMYFLNFYINSSLLSLIIFILISSNTLILFILDMVLKSKGNNTWINLQ